MHIQGERIKKNSRKTPFFASLFFMFFLTFPILCNQKSTAQEAIALITTHLKAHNMAEATAGATAFLTENTESKSLLGNELLKLGNDLFGQQDIATAATTFELLCALFPHSWTVHFNHGYALVELSRYQEATMAYARALACQPENPDTHVQHALTLLACGDYNQGWREYEWRWQMADKKPLTFPCPRLDGSNPAGKTLLLITEGAAGDIMQFIRYAKLLKERGARIMLKAPNYLKPLLRTAPYIDLLIGDHENTPKPDYYASLMSLPHLCGTTQETIPCSMPYIFVDPARKAAWHTTIAQTKKKYAIGLCWHADLGNDASRPLRARRSIPLKLFEPLAALRNTTFYNLQCDRELCAENDFPSLITFKNLDYNGAFLDTAAIIQSLDLVITVDTSIAHLAGALGIATWVILPAKSDWRWMTNRDDTPWYPNMRLFRKEDTQSWQEVITRIMIELNKKENL